MAGIEQLLKSYEKYVKLPWSASLAGPQKVWFAIYSPSDERRLRARISAFQTATRLSGHGWIPYDLTDSFPQWMASHDYREAYFETPEDIEMSLEDYSDTLVSDLKQQLEKPEADNKTVFAIFGLASLFGLIRASHLIEQIAWGLRGRLLVFFPGERDGANYRLLDARDGWNYLAIPITGDED